MSDSEKEVRVTSIDGFFKEVKKICDANKGIDFIYRGQADSDWEVITSAARRILEYSNKKKVKKSGNKGIPTQLFINYHEQLINDAKLKGHHRKNELELNDLELIAELQHYSAATCLLDFSRNAAVALWFACYEEPDKDGSVHILDISNPEKFNQVNFSDLEKHIKDFLSSESNKIWYWEPSEINHRIPKQHSIFVFGKPLLDKNLFFKKIIINKSKKARILEDLKKIYNINLKSLFSDLAGYAKANNYLEPYTEWKAEDYLIYGNYSAQRVEYERAIKYYNKAIEINPNYADAYYGRGNAKSGLDRKEEAIEDYNKAIDINPNSDKAYNNRGIAKSDLGRNEEAIEDYDKATEINPNSDKAYNNRGIVKSDLGRNEEAIEDYDKAIEINPNNAEAYNNRGIVKSDLGRKEEAIEDYDKAIEINPNYANAYNNRGIVKSNLGRKEEAIEDFDKAIEINPNYANAYYNRGNAKSELGRKEEAIEDFDKAIEINPNYANAYNNRGIAKSNLGRKEEAIEDYDKVIEIDPNHANAYYNRGNAKSGLGRKEEAKSDFDRYNELTKNDE